MSETCVEILMRHYDSKAVRSNNTNAVSSGDMIDLFLEFPALFANLSESCRDYYGAADPGFSALLQNIRHIRCRDSDHRKIHPRRDMRNVAVRMDSLNARALIVHRIDHALIAHAD